MDDLYLSPIPEDDYFTLEELGSIKFIKKKAHIIRYTQNISLKEAIKKILNNYYILNPLNAFEYIFISIEKKREFQYLIEEYNNSYNQRYFIDIDDIDDINNINYIDDVDDVDDIANYIHENKNNIKKYVSIFNIKKIKKKVLFNLELNEMRIYDM